MASRSRLPVLALLLFLLAGPVVFAGETVVREVAVADAPYAPYLRYAPMTNAPRLDWLLVTPRELLPAFAPLVAHRNETGLVADAVALEDVAADVLLGGGDVPERLRNLVRRLHRLYGLRFLVLGADAPLLPSRLAPWPVPGEDDYREPYAADAYFGCLDGFPLHTGATATAEPRFDDLDGDGDLELILGAADGILRVWDLPYRTGGRPPTWPRHPLETSR